MSENISIKIETITPQMAQNYLASNGPNRLISGEVIEQYAQDMANDRWSITGDAIRFNGNGTLLDGQHRLRACIKSDVPFQTLVVRGVETVSQEMMDIGFKRTLGHVLAIRGVHNATTCAAIAGNLGRIKRATQGAKRLSHAVLLPIFERHEACIGKWASRLGGGRSTTISPSILGAVCVMGEDILGLPDEAESFYGVFETGLAAYDGCAAHKLREMYIKYRGTHYLPHSQFQLYTAFRIFEQFRDQVPVLKIHWNRSRPEIKGLNHEEI